MYTTMQEWICQCKASIKGVNHTVVMKRIILRFRTFHTSIFPVLAKYGTAAFRSTWIFSIASLTLWLVKQFRETCLHVEYSKLVNALSYHTVNFQDIGH